MDMKYLFFLLTTAIFISFALAKNLEASDVVPASETNQASLETSRIERGASDGWSHVDSETEEKSREKRAFTPETLACIEGCDFINYK